MRSNIKTSLDIAIQIAWGMAFAHEKGLIHRDVKPANVLMTADGRAKVTDFGLARYGISLAEKEVGRPPAGIEVSTDAGTPGYMAPEQASPGGRIDYRADIFAFGVTLWRMLGGDIHWAQKSSAVAKRSVEAIVKKSGAPSLPAGILEFILRCLEPEAEDRWADFTAITEQLRNTWLSVVGEEHQRAEPKSVDLLADGLNNHGVSLLDLGEAEKAERAFEQALEADPHHIEATYNRGLVHWRYAQITDQDLVRQLEEVRSTRTDSWLDDYYLGMVHRERGDDESARQVLCEAVEQSGNDPLVAAAVRSAQESASVTRTLHGHTSRVCSAAFSPNGLWALTASDDKTVRVWELSTSRCLRTFERHTDSVHSATFSPDGLWVLSGSRDRTLCLWEVATGDCLRLFEGHTGNVYSVAFGPNGFWALSGSGDKTLRLWDMVTGRCTRIFEGHTMEVFCVAVSPNGQWALSGSRDKSLRLWELSTGRCLGTFEGHTGDVNAVVFGPDGRHAYSGGDSTLREWDVTTGCCQNTLEGHAAPITSLALSPDGRVAITGSLDCACFVRDLQTRRLLRTLSDSRTQVNSVAISPNGRLALSSFGKAVRVWDVKVPPPRAPFAIAVPQNSTVMRQQAEEAIGLIRGAREELAKGRYETAIDVIAEARRIRGYERHGGLLELNHELGGACVRKSLRAAWCVRTLEGHAGFVSSVAISPDSRSALSGSGDKTVRVWELPTGRLLTTLEGHAAEVSAVAVTPDGCYALSGSGDHTLRLWELQSRRCSESLKGHKDKVRAVAISPDGQWALSGSADGTLCAWQLPAGRCLWTFRKPSWSVDSVVISPDGRFAFSRHFGPHFDVWETSKGEQLGQFKPYNGTGRTLDLTQDGRWCLSDNSYDLRLWDARTGRRAPQCLCEGHSGAITSIATSVDGRWALSGSHDKTLRLWELWTGRCLRKFEGHGHVVSAVALSPDGRWAISGSYDTTLRLWELDWEYEYPGAADWDDGARPYLEIFLTLQAPDGRQPEWNNQQFESLIAQLRRAGYGWLRPEGVRGELEQMAANWTGPAMLPGSRK